jgi:thioredoxin reductase
VSLDEKGRADTGDFEESNVPGLYIVGDSGDVQFAIVATAEGARAAVAINKAVLREALADLVSTESYNLLVKVPRDESAF